MPHLHIESFKSPVFPASHAGAHFDFLAANAARPDESLIATRYKEKEFFLLLKKSEGKELLKIDKVTRPSPNFIAKQALLAYAECAGLNVLDSNVDTKGENAHLKNHDALKSISFFAQSFPAHERVRIEVGFGSGRHLLHQAQNNPDVLFIGLEIHKPSLEQVLKQVIIQNLSNVMVLDYDARLFLEFVPSNAIETIYVHFPVPWDKKPHRRVISEAFLNESDRVLKIGGTLELRTDSEEYYRFALETFSSPRQSRFDVRKNRDIAITSKYEDRWKKMEKNIYDVTFTCESLSPDKALEGDFIFDQAPVRSETIASLGRETHKRDWGFLHIERTFDIDDKGHLLRIAMGSFDRPESVYVLIEEGSARYYPRPPIRSGANLNAHLLLDGLLHG